MMRFSEAFIENRERRDIFRFLHAKEPKEKLVNVPSGSCEEI
jgi:hypothetical protein